MICNNIIYQNISQSDKKSFLCGKFGFDVQFFDRNIENEVQNFSKFLVQKFGKYIKLYFIKKMN
jgi:hypothetical protein